MKKIYSAADPLLLGHLRQILESEGIRTLVKNEYLSGGIGELPAMECWPELWVMDDEESGRAQRLLRDLIADIEAATVVDGAPWRCPGCGELLEAQFSECWKCSGGSLLA